jgi:hypothetical protein
VIPCSTNNSDGARREMKGIEYIKGNVVAKLFTVQSVWSLALIAGYVIDTEPVLCVCVWGGGWQQVELSCCVHPHANHGANNETRTCLCRHCWEVCWMSSELLGAAHHILQTHVIVGIRRAVSYLDGVELAPPVESFLSVVSGSVLRRNLLDL